MNELSRGDFLKLGGFTAAAAALWGCTPQVMETAATATATPTLPTPTPLPVDDDEVVLIHTLRRVTFGPLPEEIERARTIGLDAFVAEQLDPEAIPDPEIAAHLAALETIEMSAAELFAVEPAGRPVVELMGAALLRAVFSRRQLYERLVDFWSDHFNIYIRKNYERALKPVDDREVIRRHAVGDFHSLLSASAHSPAMLVYLDNVASTRDRPNENYARELMELHTLGVDGGYTQEDVREVARAFTGWGVTGPRSSNPGNFIFRSNIHDDDPKTILGQEIPAGGGVRDGEQVLEMLSRHPSTARFICKKLVRRFVADEPPESLVARAAEVFQELEGDIPQVMAVILNSDELRASLGGKVKRPLDYVASALRQTRAQIEPERARTLLYHLGAMGQPLFGWPAPDGFPDVASAWIGASALLARWNFALALAFAAVPGVRVDWEALAGSPSTFDEAVNALSDRLLGAPLPEEARAAVAAFLDGVEMNLALPALGALLLASPYFQYH